MDETALIQRYIDVQADRSLDGRADARLRDYGVPIWALIGQWQALEGDIDIVAHDYQIPREAVEAALAYYQRNKKFIDARLLLNTA